MDYKAACHRLRITPALLKWYMKYAPRADGRKLLEVSAGAFSPDELDSFDKHLRCDWGGKNVPTGIHRELEVEACGLCALCSNPCETLQLAHIERKGMEVAFYFQHPSNLIPLCGTCHTRYDEPNLRAVSPHVIKAAKERLISKKMEAIDRDVERAHAVREAVEAIKAEMRAQLGFAASPPTNATLWLSGTDRLLQATALVLTGSVRNDLAFDLGEPARSLLTLSGSHTTPGQVTHAVLDGYAQEASGAVSEAPDEWELVDAEPPEGTCFCGELKDSAEYQCGDCEHTGWNMDPPTLIDENDLGIVVPFYEDMRGDSHALECENCGGGNLQVSYPEQWCSRCRHIMCRDD